MDHITEFEVDALRERGCTCYTYVSPWVLTWQVNGDIVCPFHYAAPDLLAAAEQALGTMEWAQEHVPGTNLRSDMILLRAAIRKAKGDASGDRAH